ncbi:MAG: hypothetical protein QM809_06955 [Gordonia sp. (in: high G+C Gram-positive bacteria)]
MEQVPGARPHIPVPPSAPVAEFEAVAAAHPIFRILPAESERESG